MIAARRGDDSARWGLTRQHVAECATCLERAGVLRELEPGLAETDARLMAHAAFGLLNSTPHSMKPADSKAARAARSRAVMREMTVAALTVGAAPE